MLACLSQRAVRSCRNARVLAIGATTGLALSSAAFAVGPKVILSGVPTSTTSEIPGVDPLVQRFGKDFNNLYRSPDGNRWIVTNERSTAADPYTFSVIIGDGLTFTTPVVLTDTTITPWSTPGDEETIFAGTPWGVCYAVNDTGEWAVPVRQPVKSRIVRRAAGAWSFPAVQGDLIPGDASSRTWAAPFDVYGITPASASVYFRGSDSTNTDDWVFVGGTLKIQTAVTVPAGQLIAPTTRAWQSFGDSGYASFSASGSDYIAVGDVGPDTTNDDVLVLSDTVQAQQGAPYVGLGNVTNSRLTLPYMSPNGMFWYARGTGTPNTQHYVVRNGVVIAKNPDPIFTGAGETWSGITGYSRVFTSVVGDNAGNYVVTGGATGGPANRGVAVYNNTKVLLADGDPIDLDSNGLYDDGVFVNSLAMVDFYTNFLSETGHWYATVSLRDSTAFVGEAIVRVRVTPFCAADYDKDEDVDVTDLFAFLDNWFAQAGGPPPAPPAASADFDGNNSVDVVDLFGFLDAWFAQAGVCN